MKINDETVNSFCTFVLGVSMGVMGMAVVEAVATGAWPPPYMTESVITEENLPIEVPVEEVQLPYCAKVETQVICVGIHPWADK